MPQTPKAPWLKYFGDIPEHLVYPQGSMYEAIKDNVNQLNKINSVAYEFQGKKTTYKTFLKRLKHWARLTETSEFAKATV